MYFKWLYRERFWVIGFFIEAMAKELVPRYDPNTEAFQARAQWKKVDNCRKQWIERWSWLLDERK